MIKNKRGITLIALVVTIIILLILAGVTINMVLGDDGILNKTKVAAQKYQNAQEQEEAWIGKIENEMDKAISGNYREETVTLSKSDYDALVARITSLEDTLNEYHAGDSITYSALELPGYVTGGKNAIRGTIFLGKNIGSDVNSITITGGTETDVIRCNGGRYENYISSMYAEKRGGNTVAFELTLSTQLTAYHTVNWSVDPLTITFNGEE